MKTILAALLFTLAALGIAFPAITTGADKTIIIARQDAPRVELYITSWCPYCRQAMDFFRSRGIKFEVYDIEKDEKAAIRKNRLDNRKGVPFAVINGKKIHGYSEEVYLEALSGK